MDPEWRLWRHKQDHSVLYEVRKWENGYQVRRPGEKRSLWHFPNDAQMPFEEVYEPAQLPEEESSG